MIANVTIVGQVDIGHHPVVVAQPRHARVLHGAAIESAEFAYGIAVANFEARWFTGVLLVLRRFAQRDELENPVIAPDARVPGNHRVRTDAAAGADFDVLADYRIGADFHVVGESRTGVDQGCGMYRCQGQISIQSVWLSIVRSVHISSASVASWPSTVACAENHQMPLAKRLISTCSSSVSPGITGFLKRALSMPTK